MFFLNSPPAAAGGGEGVVRRIPGTITVPWATCLASRRRSTAILAVASRDSRAGRPCYTSALPERRTNGAVT